MTDRSLNEITDFIDSIGVKITPFDNSRFGSAILAYAELIIADCLVIRGVKIIKSNSGGLFIGYPATGSKNCGYKELIVPVNSKFEKMLRDKIINSFRNYSLE